MSRVAPDIVNVTDAGIGSHAGTSPTWLILNVLIRPPIGDRQYPPWSAQNQAWRGGSDFVDSSGPIFSMYMEMAEEEDKKMAESWKADAEGILIFVHLHLLV